MDYSGFRKKMVEHQLIPRGIEDEGVLSAFGKIKREAFVPIQLKKDAYEDFPLSIGEAQTISQPYMAALMTQCLELKGGEKVLEIGTGSGYQTAVLAELTGQVYSIERMHILARRAERLLEELAYTNIKILIGDGTLGWEESSPYDRILVTAGAKEVPSPLMEQLGEGGLIVIPVGGAYSQELKVVRKEKCHLKTKAMERCIFVPLVGKYGWEEDARNI